MLEVNKANGEIFRKRVETDEEFAKQIAERGRRNMKAFHERMANGEFSEEYMAARKEHQRNLHKYRKANTDAKFKKHLESLNITQHVLEEYIQSSEDNPNNHKVIQLEYIGLRDVHVLVVDGDSFALLAGVFVR